MQLFVNPPLTRNHLKKGRRGRRALSCTSSSASTSSGQIYSAASHIEKSEIHDRPLIPSTLSTFVSSCRPRSAPVSNTDGSGCPTATPENCMGQGYEHPGPDHPCTHIDMYPSSQTPHSGICCCSDFAFISSIDIHDPKQFQFQRHSCV